MINKKAMRIRALLWLGLLTAGCLVVLSPFIQPAQAEVFFFNSDEGYFFEVETVFSDWINSYIIADARITNVTIVTDQLSRYTVTNETAWYELQTSGLIDYINGLESQNNWNKAHVTIYPDNEPAPLCLLDVTTDQINGLYSINNQLFLLPNDPRCPTP